MDQGGQLRPELDPAFLPQVVSAVQSEDLRHGQERPFRNNDYLGNGAFPTCVGVNRKTARNLTDEEGFPHVRGGEPRCPSTWRGTGTLSPRAWG